MLIASGYLFGRPLPDEQFDPSCDCSSNNDRVREMKNKQMGEEALSLLEIEARLKRVLDKNRAGLLGLGSGISAIHC